MIGTFDTKGLEFEFLRDQILTHGFRVLAMNVGVMEAKTRFPIQIEADTVARKGNSDLQQLRADADRGASMKVMAAGAAVAVKDLLDAEGFDAVIGMGGTGGTSVITSAMRSLPVGMPKICVTTAASGDVSMYVGASDIILFPAIADVSGINRITRRVFTQAAGAVCGMSNCVSASAESDRPIVAASMFGNTTACVEYCSGKLSVLGFEVLVFHATGAGGRSMESLVCGGSVEAVLDITTTEWADEICDGVFSAGPDRLSAPGRNGIPHLIVPGCVDMVNFGPVDTVPQRYVDDKRLFYEWNPSVTLMRTNEAENRHLGRIFAEKANAATAPVAILLPLRGVSLLGAEGQPFHSPEADAALFDALKATINAEIPMVEVDCNINDTEFCDTAVDMLMGLMNKAEPAT